jgi:hypothetical protein
MVACNTRARGGIQLREAEVEHLHLTVVGQHDVGRFQVAMDDPFVVCRLERVDDLARDRQRFGHGKRAGQLEFSRERFAVDELEYQEPCPRLVVESVDAADVRVIERREYLGLALEARDPFGIVREALRQDLDR